MTLCDLVYAILRRGGSNLQSRFLNPDAVLNDSVAAQSPREVNAPELVLFRERLATPRTTFREDCIKGGGLGRCLKGA